MSEDEGVGVGPARPLRNYAKSKRPTMNIAEEILWPHLRAGRLDGRKFKRHVPIGPYFVDLLCRSERLIIELGGGEYDSSPDKEIDPRRDAWLEREGYTLLYFTSEEVAGDCDAVVETIRAQFSSSSPRPGAPSPVTGKKGSVVDTP